MTTVVAVRQMVALRENARLVQDHATRWGEARFRSLGQHASDLTTVVDAGGVVQYHSPSLELLTGRAAEALVGRPLMDPSLRVDSGLGMRLTCRHACSSRSLALKVKVAAAWIWQWCSACRAAAKKERGEP